MIAALADLSHVLSFAILEPNQFHAALEILLEYIWLNMAKKFNMELYNLIKYTL